MENKLKLSPVCKIHKVPMVIAGFEYGHRVWSCYMCKDKNGKKK